MSTTNNLPAPNPPGETANTHQMVRQFIWDRTIEDNPIELDLEFSDQEIGNARQYAVMMLNAIPPFVHQLRVDNIPGHWAYCVLLATTYHLFLAKAMQLARKDMDYSAGNMQVDINKRRLDFYMKWSKELKVEAESTAKTLKVAQNLESAYGQVG